MPSIVRSSVELIFSVWEVCGYAPIFVLFSVVVPVVILYRVVISCTAHH